MKLTKVIQWIDLNNPEKTIFGVKAKHNGKWMDVISTDGDSPPFFTTKKEAEEFAKKVENKFKTQHP